MSADSRAYRHGARQAAGDRLSAATVADAVVPRH
jgi:hypothetical protein